MNLGTVVKYVSWFWSNFIRASETKATFIGFLWAAGAKGFPNTIPLILPPLDMGDMGTMTLSPAALAIYVLGRAAFKAMAKDSIPFWPDPGDRIPLNPTPEGGTPDA